MQFVSVREFRVRPGKVWRDLAASSELVVTSNGKPVGLLVNVPAGELETTLRAYRQSRALLALAATQERSRQRGTVRFTARQIEAEIKAVRRARRA